MTALEKILGTQGPVRLNHLGVHTWGPNPRRVVRIHVYQTDEQITAVVYGAKMRDVVELERFDLSALERQATRKGVAITLVTTDGRRLESPPGGCGCGTPLKHWQPPGWRAGT